MLSWPMVEVEGWNLRSTGDTQFVSRWSEHIPLPTFSGSVYYCHISLLPSIKNIDRLHYNHCRIDRAIESIAHVIISIQAESSLQPYSAVSNTCIAACTKGPSRGQGIVRACEIQKYLGRRSQSLFNSWRNPSNNYREGSTYQQQ
jgi:hypothetical protein